MHRPPELSRGHSDQFRHSNNNHTLYFPTPIRRHSSPPRSQTNIVLQSVSDSPTGETTKEISLHSSGLGDISSLESIEMLRQTPRIASIESVSSSASSSPSSRHQNDASSPEIANLIAAAGSAEAVIEYLLKEKKSQSAQNTQLWRLVDKQRAMILGLNKDLERALKDKEHYRRKAKAFLADNSEPHKDRHPAPPNPEPTSIDRPSRISFENLKNDAFGEAKAIELDSPTNVVLAPYPLTPSASQFNSSKTSNLFEPEQHMPPTLVDGLKDFEEFSPRLVHALTRDESPESLPQEKYFSISQPPNIPLPNIPTFKESPSQTASPEEIKHRQRKSPPIPLQLQNADPSTTQRNINLEEQRTAGLHHESETRSKDGDSDNMDILRSIAQNDSALNTTSTLR